MEWSAGRVPSGPSPFLEGLCVRLTGLQQRGHLNDRIGTLVKFHTEWGMWQVNVDGDSLLLKASNLCERSEGPRADADAEVLGDAPPELLEGMSVRVRGLLPQQNHLIDRMNGSSGTLGKFHPDVGRWEVLNVDDGWRVDIRLLLPSNLREISAGPRAGADAEVVQEASSEGMCVERGRDFEFVKDILARGLGICNCCRTHLWPCDQCKDEKARADYSDGQWNHRHSRGAVCRVCAEARCEVCDCRLGDEQHQCAQCQHYKTAAHFSESMWQHRLTRRTVCLACAGGSERQATVQCELCGEHFTAEGFTRGMWENKSRKRRTLCKTCCRPLCTNAECRTCKTCRDPQCRARRHCEAEVQALNPKCLPQKVEELATWLCAKCTPTFCSRWPLCSKKRMSKTLYTTDQYTCGDCKK